MLDPGSRVVGPRAFFSWKLEFSRAAEELPECNGEGFGHGQLSIWELVHPTTPIALKSLAVLVDQLEVVLAKG